VSKKCGWPPESTLNINRTGGQIKNNDTADDVRNIDLTKIHYLSGPFEIENAAPGDVLLVEIMDVQPFQDHPWGFTGVFDRRNGGGFLDEIYPSAYDIPPLFSPVLHLPRLDVCAAADPSACEVPRLSGTLRASTAPHVTYLMSNLLDSSILESWDARHRPMSSQPGIGEKAS
jgi:formamidase